MKISLSKYSFRTPLVCATFFLLLFHLPAPIASGYNEEAFGPLTAHVTVQGLARPVFLTVPPGDRERHFIVEQGGWILIYDTTSEELLDDPFLTVTDISTGGERGLLGLAFHPDYAGNGFFFINFTDSAGDTVIRRYTVSSEDPDRADPESATTVFTFEQDFSNHNGGWIGFSPDDGYLYIASGDGGSGNDPNNRGQDTSQLLGKMLRINVDGDDFPEDDNRNYAIPQDNPFVNADGRDEIWAYGLRNPWRSSFDRETGDLWIADVGQSAREWIHFQPGGSEGGQNYGWRIREGTLVTGMDPLVEGIVDPIYEFPHPEGRAIIGGYVYRGEDMPALRGTYFFGDYMEDWVRSFRYEGELISNEEVTDWTEALTPSRPVLSNPVSFGEDADLRKRRKPRMSP
ncbi:MAG: PQQ-dependent sugar dehydrogenase [Opitutales bacterium]